MLNQLQYGDVLVSAKDASQHLIASAKPLHGFIQVVCERTGSSQFHLYEQLKRDIATGLYRIKRKGSPKHSPLQQGDAQLDATQSRALSLCNQIKQYMHKYGVSERRAYQALTESHEGRPSVTLSTVYRYMQRLRHGLPPLRGAKNKGPRSRIQLEDRTLVCQLACQYYLEPSSRYSTSAFVKHVNEALRAPREGLSEERRKQLATSLSRKAILGIIRRNITRTEDKERMQPELRQAAFSIATKKIRVSGPLMRVEQDALHLPFQVATPDGISSNVYVVHCIDAYSGVVLGWSLSIGTPDVQATLRCLEKALFPKREILGEYGISTPNDYFGTPAEIVFDNGPENHGVRIQALSRLGISVTHCKARQAQQKPYIERLNRSLKEALETLPGSTRFNRKDGKRVPKEGPIGIEELEAWLVKWYYQAWLHTPLERHKRSIFSAAPKGGETPAEVWSHAQDMGVPIPLSPSPDQWRLAYYERSQRMLARTTGITMNGFSFRGPNLKELYSIFGTNEVTVLSNPDDFRHVYVLGDDEALYLLQNSDTDETTPALSFRQARELLAQTSTKQEHPEKRAFNEQLFQHNSSQPISNPPLKGKSKSIRISSKETAAKNKLSAAIARTNEPLPKAAGLTASTCSSKLDVSKRPTGLSVKPRRS